jgi:hypothetical protein
VRDPHEGSYSFCIRRTLETLASLAVPTGDQASAGIIVIGYRHRHRALAADNVHLIGFLIG